MRLYDLTLPVLDTNLPPTFSIVFLHYFGGSHAAWNTVSTLLRDQCPRCQTIALDLRGHGRSPAGTDYSVTSMAQDVLETLASISFAMTNPFVLVGHSMGGKIAMQIAAMQPEHLSGLILVAPSPPTPEPMTEQERQESLAAWNNDEASRQALRKVTGVSLPDGSAQQFIHDRSRTTKAAWEAWYCVGSLENIGRAVQEVQVPTVVLAGEKDPVVGPEVQRRETLGYLQHAFLSVVPDAGHLLPYEAPEATAHLISTVLPYSVD